MKASHKKLKPATTTPDTFPALASRNPDLTISDGPWPGCGQPRAPLTAPELNMMGAMGAVRDKPDWQRKVGDATVTARWRRELEEQHFHRTQVDWVLEELAWAAKHTPTLSPVDGVYQSDGTLGPELAAELRANSAALEALRDEHPGTNGQVIDVIHPSLYPWVRGLSRVVTQEGLPWEQFIGGGAVMELEQLAPERELVEAHYGNDESGEDDDTDSISKRFQWLPSELSVAADGLSCKFESYVNNVHPERFALLYRTLERCFVTMIPLLEQVLGDLATRGQRIRVHESHRLLKPESPVLIHDEDGEVDEDAQYEFRFHAANVGVFHPPTVSERVTLAGRKLQVIVKLANIELTPDKPTYRGGSWHVEGCRNESIVATGIHYLETTNITESRLAFRVDCWQPEDRYEQNDAHSLFKLDYKLCQNLGSVTCLQGRTVAWPNTLQHQVQDFELVDPTKPGIRRILVFFLVDPAVRVLRYGIVCVKTKRSLFHPQSTAFVPPQQQDWFTEFAVNNKIIPGMPRDVQGLIASQNEWHFPHEKALQVRLDLMEERKFLQSANTAARFERQCSLCEH